MGMKMLMHKEANKYTISIDNQAAIQTTCEDRSISGQYLVKALHKQAEELRRKQQGTEVVLGWIPGHMGISGNKRADKEAKKAAKKDESRLEDIPDELRGNLPKSRTAENQRHHKELQNKAKEQFAKSPRAPMAHKIDPTMPSSAFYKLSREKMQRQTSLLVQLCTGHIGLNKYLHQIRKADSPICPACKSEAETTHHYLMRCLAYEQERVRLEQKLKGGAREMKILLSNLNAIPHLFRYINETGRFRSTYGNIE